MKIFIRRLIRYSIRKLYGNNADVTKLFSNPSENNIFYNKNSYYNSTVSDKAKIYSRFTINESKIHDYTYIAENAIIRLTTIGKFCSIGANFVCGWGIHPTNGISTSPMFYSSQKQNGTSLSEIDKIEETKPISIGNDVFIGMNVTVLDGVSVGNGAIIGAGCVVSKDVPPYAIVAGNPMRILRYRFNDDIICQLQRIQWWDWDLDKLKSVEKLFFNVDEFVEKFK